MAQLKATTINGDLTLNGNLYFQTSNKNIGSSDIGINILYTKDIRTLSGGSIAPWTNNDGTLGIPSKFWSKAYISQVVLPNGVGIIPENTNATQLGISTNCFKSIRTTLVISHTLENDPQDGNAFLGLYSYPNGSITSSDSPREGSIRFFLKRIDWDEASNTSKDSYRGAWLKYTSPNNVAFYPTHNKSGTLGTANTAWYSAYLSKCIYFNTNTSNTIILHTAGDNCYTEIRQALGLDGSTTSSSGRINLITEHWLSGPKKVTAGISISGNGGINYNAGPAPFRVALRPYNETWTDLGTTDLKFGNIYCTNGTIQTSNREEKSHIHYIDGELPSSSLAFQNLSPLTVTNTNTTSSLSISDIQNEEETFSTQDIINFIKKLNPATFIYKNNGQEMSLNEALSSSPGSIQLGLIADDIKDNALYKYIGVEEQYDKTIEEETDEEGNVIKEAITEPKIAYGLKAIPLATLALTACKYLINQIEKLQSSI